MAIMSQLKQFKSKFGLGFAALCILLASQFSYAGDFYARNGAAIEGSDAVAYFTENRPVQGVKEIMLEYKGSMFLFASSANRDKFKASPESYMPQFNGYCAYGAAGGYKAKIDPRAFSVVDGKLYLNYNAAVKTMWNKDVGGYIDKAEKLWPKTVLTKFSP
jgi:YHS domain-containing protein